MNGILFRGKVYRKNRRTGEYLDCGWVYGDYYRYYNGSLHSTITNIDMEEMQSREYSVESATVGESIGLKDKTGKDIFEGDILKETLLDGSEKFYKVWKEKGGFVVNIHQDDFKKRIENIHFWSGCSDMQNASWIQGSLEVIGNVHDNPKIMGW